MSNRAPDNQPTENIRAMLYDAQQRLTYWESVHVMNERALKTSTRNLPLQQLALLQLEGWLATRLQEEQESVELNGL